MRLTSENKRKITHRIRAGAAKTFREHGYDAVSLDRLMEEANLTRGAFYAHYRSKAELFLDVVRHEHPLLVMLRSRTGESPDALYAQMSKIFEDYLNIAHLEEIFRGCSLAALTGDVTRAKPEVKLAYGEAFNAICAEMAREQKNPQSAYIPALIMATGAIQAAKAMEEFDQRRTLLEISLSTFRDLLPRPG